MMTSNPRLLTTGVLFLLAGALSVYGPNGAKAAEQEVSPFFVELRTMYNEKDEWSDFFGIQGSEIKVTMQRPVYGASLRIEVWKPGDLQRPSYTQVFGGRTFKEETLFTCTYRLYFLPSRLKAIAAPNTYPAYLSWTINRPGELAGDNPTEFGGKQRFAIPEDCLDLPGYKVSPSPGDYFGAHMDLKSPFPLFHFFFANRGYSVRSTPEETRKAYPHYVHIIGWFEPILKQYIPGVDQPEPSRPEFTGKGAGGEGEGSLLPNGTAAPEWSLATTTGQQIGSSELRGKLSVINFWATWCGPCMAELPDFVALQSKYAPQRVQFVGLSIDHGFSSSQLDRYLRWNLLENPINYPIGVAPESLQKRFGGISSVPVTYVITPDGKVGYSHLGRISKETLDKELKRLLDLSSPVGAP